MPEKQFVYKIMVLGDPSVGKTSLIRRFVENRFSEEYLSTIGVEFLKKEVSVDENTRVTMVLWDVAGQAKWTQFKKAYYQGSLFIIAVFDVTNAKSYRNIKRWVSEAQEILGEKIDFTIFANKIDLLEGQAIPAFDEYNQYKGFLAPVIQTSAKTGKNVNDTFMNIAKFLVKKIGKRG
ncbi:MAG: GTP-binding protein [Candidatus Helarchaeota archaeon]|nr:GTP-binding protein [Candidatus Helarchaeota archaeon]